MSTLATGLRIGTVVWLVAVALPAYGIYCGWRNRPVRLQSWRDWFSFISLLIATVSLVLFAAFWMWPDFGAEAGSGTVRFRYTALLLASLAWLSVAAFGLALVGTVKVIKRIVVPVSIVAALFWWAAMAGARGEFVDEEAREMGLPNFPERQFAGAWSMDATCLQAFSRNVNGINVGDDMRKVVAVLGPPDRDGHVHKNDYVRMFTYYVSRKRSDPLSTDLEVIVVFNSKARVTRVCSDAATIEQKNCPF
jgi:hypothetical protein